MDLKLALPSSMKFVICYNFHMIYRFIFHNDSKHKYMKNNKAIYPKQKEIPFCYQVNLSGKRFCNRQQKYQLIL